MTNDLRLMTENLRIQALYQAEFTDPSVKTEGAISTSVDRIDR